MLEIIEIPKTPPEVAEEVNLEYLIDPYAFVRQGVSQMAGENSQLLDAVLRPISALSRVDPPNIATHFLAGTVSRYLCFSKTQEKNGSPVMNIGSKGIQLVTQQILSEPDTGVEGNEIYGMMEEIHQDDPEIARLLRDLMRSAIRNKKLIPTGISEAEAFIEGIYFMHDYLMHITDTSSYTKPTMQESHLYIPQVRNSIVRQVVVDSILDPEEMILDTATQLRTPAQESLLSIGQARRGGLKNADAHEFFALFGARCFMLELERRGLPFPRIDREHLKVNFPELEEAVAHGDSSRINFLVYNWGMELETEVALTNPHLYSAFLALYDPYQRNIVPGDLNAKDGFLMPYGVLKAALNPNNTP